MATIRRRSDTGVYFLDLRLPGGKRKRISLETTDQKLASIKAQLIEREVANPRPKRRTTVEQFEAEYLTWLAKTKSPAYVASQRIALKRLRTIIPHECLDEYSPRDVDMFKAELLDSGISPHTVDMYLRTLRSCFGTALKWELIEANPFKGVAMLHEELPDPRVLSDEEKGRILAKVRELYPGDEPALEFLLQTGLRRGELVKLEWSDVDWKRDVLIVRNVQKGKRRDRRPRVVPLLARAKKILQARRDQIRPFLFNPDTLSRHYKRAAVAAGVKDTELHDLRRTYASYLLSRGVPRDVVDRIIGHAEFSVTDRHYFAIPPEVVEKLKAIDVLQFPN